MAVCTFFGHRECPDTIKPKLREILVDLIVNHNKVEELIQSHHEQAIKQSIIQFWFSLAVSIFGFLFIVLVPSFLIFVYEVYSLIIEIKYGKDEE